MSRPTDAWLLRLADPEAVPDAAALPLLTEAQFLVLSEEAARHGVLPALARALKAPAVAARLPAEADAARRQLRDTIQVQIAFNLLLAHQADRLFRRIRAAGLPVALVKGRVFGERLYADPSLRTFTDLDLLMPPAARPAAEAVLAEAGFVRVEDPSRDDYEEVKWLHRERSEVMVEMHGNLVHSPRLRSSLSLGWDDLASAPGWPDAPAPEALLLIASVHGASSHQFDRLQHLVDVTLAARRLAAAPAGLAWLEATVARTRTRLALVAALDLAARAFDDRACRDLAARFAPVRYRGAARRLLTPALSAAAYGPRAGLGSWRRKAFRHLLKLGIPR